MFRLGYNTNGLAHHRIEDALPLLAELGYRAVAITPDVGQLDLLRLDRAQVRRVKRLARELDLAIAIETGARYVLDPARKHFPSVLEVAAKDRRRRIDWWKRSVDLAADLGAPVVSIWSGAAPSGVTGDPLGPTPGVLHHARHVRRAPAGRSPASRHPRQPRRVNHDPAECERAWELLVAGLEPVLDHARSSNVRIGFEPEPGMFVERPSGYLELCRRLGRRGGELGLTLDVGHLVATFDLPVPAQIAALGARLVHVQLDDAPLGRHEHLPFGRGDLDLPGTLKALLEAGYAGMAAVELSRDSHRAPLAAAEALAAIRRASPRRLRQP